MKLTADFSIETLESKNNEIIFFKVMQEKFAKLDFCVPQLS